jgi:exonuclease III
LDFLFGKSNFCLTLTIIDLLKIATYNVNGINGRLAVLLRWLKEAKPDVVCLQELKCPDKLFPEAAILKAGYHSIWHGQKSWNGVAILAKEEIKETRRNLDGDPLDLHSRYIEGFVYGMVIGCLYLPESRLAYQKLLTLGWTDAVRYLHPNKRIYTFYDYLRNAYGRDAGLRLDHFLLNDNVLPRLISAQVDKEVRGWEKSSDHCPVWIELTNS